MSSLTVILLNPKPEGSTSVSVKRVHMAAQILGLDGVTIVNLTGASSVDSSALRASPSDSSSWMLARRELHSAMEGAENVLAAWGLGGLGPRWQPDFISQRRWLVSTMKTARISRAWTLDGKPRHPSRWHQHLAQSKGRFLEETFEQRMASALCQVPVEQLY